MQSLAVLTPAALAARLGAQNKVRAQRYLESWDSIDSRPIPSWYNDAKFGIFIHWGVYSVPAYAAPNVKNQNPYAEWYWHSLEEGKKAAGPTDKEGMTWEFHKRVYGADFPYPSFAPLFRAELYDPDRWADLFVRSGAKYVALTSKHHEGFTLWKNEQANRSWGRPWNSVDVGPHRDLLLDLMQAGRRRDLHMGIYYSLYEWYNPLWLHDKPRYVSEHMIPQFKHVVEHAEPDIIFSDGEWELPSADWHSTEILAWLYNESSVREKVVVDDRWGKDTRHKHGGYFTTEYTSGIQNATHPWEESRGMGFSYGYNRAETLADYHTDRQLLLMLVDIVSRGGNLLLDIGPRADGGIPVVMEERLLHIGEWLGPNGEAIYGTKPWARPAQWSEGNRPHLEEKEFRAEYDITRLVDSPAGGNAHIESFFTSKGDTVYALLPHWPAATFALRNVRLREGAKVTLLENGVELPWKAEGADVAVAFDPRLRSEMPRRELYTLKLTGAREA